LSIFTVFRFIDATYPPTPYSLLHCANPMVGICPDLIKATQQQRHFEERGNIYTLMGLTYMNLNKY